MSQIRLFIFFGRHQETPNGKTQMVKGGNQAANVLQSYNFSFHYKDEDIRFRRTSICFICCAVFDRIDSPIAHKHSNRGSEEYVEAVNDYKKGTEKIPFAKNSFPKDAKHNLKETLKKNTEPTT